MLSSRIRDEVSLRSTRSPAGVETVPKERAMTMQVIPCALALALAAPGSMRTTR
jgi:hypothetical protein